MRSFVLAVLTFCAFSTCEESLIASEPKLVALNAVAALFVRHDIADFKSFVSPDAIQGNGKPGSALAKTDKQRPESMTDVVLSQVVFFGLTDIDRLEKQFPDDLWPRVRKHAGHHQGVLIKLSLTGPLAERARSAGKDPNDVAMMTWIINTDPEPKIIHIDDN